MMKLLSKSTEKGLYEFIKARVSTEEVDYE